MRGLPGLGSRVMAGLRRRAGAWSVVVLVAIVVVWSLVFRAAPAAPETFAPPTGFGGYTLAGPVTEISARITVPTLFSAGNASSWVGLQQNNRIPFVQVGVLEVTGAYYEAFWSSSVAGFHPHLIESVTPGQVITCSIERDSSGQWKWSIAGPAVTPANDLFPHFQGTTFSEAEWMQEDPGSAGSASDVPYPMFVHQVRFADLSWNNHSPRLTLADGHTMMPNGGSIETPGPVIANAFSLHPPSGAAATYLALAREFDQSYFKIAFDLKYWSRRSVSVRRHDIATYIAIVAHNDAALLAPTWSTPTHQALVALVALNRRLSQDLRAWLGQGLLRSDPAYQDYLTLLVTHNALVQRVRASVGATPT